MSLAQAVIIRFIYSIYELFRNVAPFLFPFKPPKQISGEITPRALMPRLNFQERPTSSFENEPPAEDLV